MSDSFTSAMRKRPKVKPSGPVWKGPTVDGITFSLLSRFLTCRERFKAYVIDGWRANRTFNHRIEYGHLFHTAEEAYYAGLPWGTKLKEYRDELSQKYPMDREAIVHWWRVCTTQFQEYVRNWAYHDGSTEGLKTAPSIGQEYQFDVPLKLPSGRRVRLRGKIDGLHQKPFIIRETKTKGEIDLIQLQRQLTFDLQTMLYCTVVTQQFAVKGPIKVLYNLVLRPLSGGKGSIRKHKPTKTNPRGETDDEFYARLGGIMREEPGQFFQRIEVPVQPVHVKRFREKCLDPLLEAVCNWYSTTCWHTIDFSWLGTGLHWQHPFGVHNTLDEGGHTDLDEYISTGSTVGLERVETLFEELT